jgi:hypothetical protein
MAGMTFFLPMRAVLRMPKRIFFIKIPLFQIAGCAVLRGVFPHFPWIWGRNNALIAPKRAFYSLFRGAAPSVGRKPRRADGPPRLDAAEALSV